MTFLNRHRSRIRPVGPFSPSSLFFGGIPGAWYDPTDLSTMFQDSAGTTPVTAVEQPVGLILDKSQGLALGADVVTNGDFSSGASWTLSAGGGSATIAAGLLTLSGGAAAFPNATQSGILTAGRWYRVTVVLTTPITLNSLSFRMGGGTTTYSGFTAAGTYTLTLLADGTNLVFLRNSGFTDTVNVDSVSVLPLAGNHASQSTAASRPTYRARYNALTQSETFTGAPWLTGSTAGAITRGTTSTQDPTGATSNVSTVAFPAVGAGQFSIVYQDSGATYLNVSVTWSVWLRVASGTATIYLNVEDTAAGPSGGNFFASPALTLTTTWQRFTLTGTRTTNTGNLGVFFGFDTRAAAGQTNPAPLTVQVWGAQLLTAADVTATGNAYQRIAAATVYDTAPVFRPYLAFDGLDDSLATSAINFTATDKMTVFAGLSKLSDAALGIFAELSTVTGTNAGSWYLAAPISTGASGNYQWRNAGTTLAVGVSSGTLLAPRTDVLTGTSNIAAPLQVLRVDGVQVGTDTGTMGTGNYGNWPLFIGRRNNASFPFNGRLYSLIVRGAASSVTEIADTELWVNARTGGY